MKHPLQTILAIALLVLVLQECAPQMLAEASEWPDMLTPTYYQTSDCDVFRAEVDLFLTVCQGNPFHHPLANAQGQMPEFTGPAIGVFGAKKGPDVAARHHAAVDLHVQTCDSLRLHRPGSR